MIPREEVIFILQEKTAFLAIVGRPNVGKSSLLNILIGTKIAIVTSKPQTTRTRIMGVLTEGQTQLVFIDTPGLHRPRNRLGESMVKAVAGGINDVDACVLVVDASKRAADEIHESDKEIIDKIKARKMPSVLILNKIDLLGNPGELLTLIDQYRGVHSFDAIIPVSCKTGEGIDVLRKEIGGFAKEERHFFERDTLTDQPERVIAAEIIREKLLTLLDEEIPHGIAVGIEKFSERIRENGAPIIDIEAVIYCEKDSHKGIIIGKKGAMLKKIGSLARIDLEEFFESAVGLNCWVKVKGDWRNRQGLIRGFGLD